MEWTKYLEGVSPRFLELGAATCKSCYNWTAHTVDDENDIYGGESEGRREFVKELLSTHATRITELAPGHNRRTIYGPIWMQRGSMAIADDWIALPLVDEEYVPVPKPAAGQNRDQTPSDEEEEAEALKAKVDQKPDQTPSDREEVQEEVEAPKAAVDHKPHETVINQGRRIEVLLWIENVPYTVKWKADSPVFVPRNAMLQVTKGQIKYDYVQLRKKVEEITTEDRQEDQENHQAHQD